MAKVMIEHNGIGLAAPQVALSYSVFIMLDPEDPSKTISFYNPEILYHSDDSEWGTEGCLSLLGLTTQVLRFKWIELAFEDSEGISHRWKMYGQSARCAQHEIDHLNGILIFDHIQSKLRRLIFLEKCRKARKKYDRLR
jgi:peptide deformylase